MKDGDIVVARVRGESVYFVGKLSDCGDHVKIEDAFILLLQFTQQGMMASLVPDPVFESFDFKVTDIIQMKEVDSSIKESYLQACNRRSAQKVGLTLASVSPLR